MNYLDWQVGDRVACIDDYGDRFLTPGLTYNGGLDGLTEGRIYTIRTIGLSPFDGNLCIWLDEIVRPLHSGIEAGFDVRRFRKVHPRKTSIAIFEQMLHPSKQGVDA